MAIPRGVGSSTVEMSSSFSSRSITSRTFWIWELASWTRMSRQGGNLRQEVPQLLLSNQQIAVAEKNINCAADLRCLDSIGCDTRSGIAGGRTRVNTLGGSERARPRVMFRAVNQPAGLQDY